MNRKSWPWGESTFDAPMECLRTLRSNVSYRKKVHKQKWSIERIAGIGESGETVPMLRITRVVE